MPEPLVVGVGHVGAVLVAQAPAAAAGTIFADQLTTTPAPGVAVALWSATTLGCSARLGGLTGADPLGSTVRSLIGRAGIDVELLRPRGATPVAVHVASPRGTERLLRFAGNDDGGVEVELATLVAGAQALLLDGSAVTAQIAAAELARAKGIPVILDAGEVVEGLGELIGLVDVLLASERLATELAPRSDLRDALQELAAMGPGAVVITLGEAGAIGQHGDQVVECPAFPANVVDTTGAGSVFHGAFTAALLGKLPFVRCVEVAAAAAALSCEGLGPWDGVPSRDRVFALVKTR